MKKAFTLIELLYSLMLLSALFAIALPVLKHNTLTTRTIDLKDNIYNMYKMQQNIYTKTSDYDTINRQTLTNSSIVTSSKGYNYILKKNYTVETKPVVCKNNLKGVYIYLKDNNINKTAEINSCNTPVKISLN